MGGIGVHCTLDLPDFRLATDAVRRGQQLILRVRGRLLKLAHQLKTNTVGQTTGAVKHPEKPICTPLCLRTFSTMVPLKQK